MSNDHVDAHLRGILDRITHNHRAALEELREGNAALTNCAAKGSLKPDGTRMPAEPPICQKCGDGGWWTNNSGFHYCECPAGVMAQEEDAA